MDKLFAKRMDELVPSGIRKVNEKALAMERAGETVIHFELGRPDFDTPEYIKNACIEDIKKGDVFYTSNFGTMELREAIAWKLKTQNNVEYKPTEIIVSVGLSEAVFDVMAAILDEGDPRSESGLVKLLKCSEASGRGSDYLYIERGE